jgi:shikimate dehydrogenase
VDIDAHTKLCGVIGNPVEHSLSPAIHNAAFRKLGLNYVYLAFRVEDLPGAVAGMRALGNLRGFSVTIPHKVALIPLLDEVEPMARHIGAVNTIVIEKGALTGYNTDASGALRALREGGAALDRGRVVVLGSGGAARAIAFALGMEPAGRGIADLTILAVIDDERRRLAKDLRDKTPLVVLDDALNERTLRRAIANCQVLVHCTPLGMHPKVDESCVPASLLAPHLSVMDIVYNPLETRLLREANAAGCRTIRGVDMFLNQAMAQFELWTGQTAPADVMRAVLESSFGR